MDHSFFVSPLFVWIVMPLLIFLARIVDVSLQTVRIISISRGIRWLAPLVGFFEVLVWLMAIGQIMKRVSHPVAYIAYAAGFATGTYIGMRIDERLSLGTVLLRIITPNHTADLRERLRDLSFGFTTVDGHGSEGPVEIVLTVIRRQHLDAVLTLVKELVPGAFYSVEEVASARQGVYPLRPSTPREHFFPFRFLSKRK